MQDERNWDLYSSTLTMPYKSFSVNYLGVKKGHFHSHNRGESILICVINWLKPWKSHVVSRLHTCFGVNCQWFLMFRPQIWFKKYNNCTQRTHLLVHQFSLCLELHLTRLLNDCVVLYDPGVRKSEI